MTSLWLDRAILIRLRSRPKKLSVCTTTGPRDDDASSPSSSLSSSSNGASSPTPLSPGMGSASEQAASPMSPGWCDIRSADSFAPGTKSLLTYGLSTVSPRIGGSLVDHTLGRTGKSAKVLVLATGVPVPPNAPVRPVLQSATGVPVRSSWPVGRVSRLR